MRWFFCLIIFLGAEYESQVFQNTFWLKKLFWIKIIFDFCAVLQHNYFSVGVSETAIKILKTRQNSFTEKRGFEPPLDRLLQHLCSRDRRYLVSPLSHQSLLIADYSHTPLLFLLLCTVLLKVEYTNFWSSWRELVKQIFKWRMH